MEKLVLDAGLMAQAWCTKENENKEMDVNLAFACNEIAQRQIDEWYEVNVAHKITETEFPLLEWINENPVYLRIENSWVDPINNKEVGSFVEITFAKERATHTAKLVCIKEMK